MQSSLPESALPRCAMLSFAIALALVAAACKPDLGAPVSLIQETRLLAVKSEPPEAAPGAKVELTALVASPDGVSPGPVAWSDCTTPKPPVENGFVSPVCLTQPDDDGKVGLVVDDTVPAQACTFFGPVAPPVQPPVRGRDADSTGGFYFPIRAALRGAGSSGEDVLGFGAVRLARSCGLSYAEPQTRTRFIAEYALNHNPTLGDLTAIDATGTASTWQASQSGVLSAVVAPGAALTLRQAWSSDAAESFLVYDVATLALSPAREALSVSWFVTDGVLAHDKTGRAADEQDAFAENLWTAPAQAREVPVHLWAVVRDSRGGVAWATYAIQVGGP